MLKYITTVGAPSAGRRGEESRGEGGGGGASETVMNKVRGMRWVDGWVGECGGSFCGKEGGGE